MNMRMKKTLLGIPFLPLLLSSCQVSNQGSNAVYLSGEIVNPNDEFVVLYSGDQVVDSARLDVHNRFTFVLPELSEGLYHFYHYPEQQYVFLERGDSLRIRLNTQDFDESLSFSGKGSSVNNFLISMFLAYEREAEEVKGLYGLSPTDFSSRLDHMRNDKLEEMLSLSQSDGWSPEAIRMARAAIDFDNFIHREKYPFYHRRSEREETFHELPESFYSYRKDLNINNRELSYFRPYYEFMKYHIGNISYMNCMENCAESHQRESASLHLGKHKMQLIDSLVVEHNLRNNLLRNVAIDYMLQNPRFTSREETFLNEFNALSSNPSHKQEISLLYNGIKNLQTNNPFPEDIRVVDQHGDEVVLRQETYTQPAVIYFWTGNQQGHLKGVIQRIEQLKETNSEYRYIGVALRTELSQWKKSISDYGLEPSEQFLGTDFENLRNKLVIESLNKCLIVKEGKIVEAFANIHHPLPAISNRKQGPVTHTKRAPIAVE